MKQDVMDQQIISALLQRIPELTERTPFCPQDELIAQYFDAHLADPAHAQVQNHIADCAHCQAKLGAIARPLLYDSCVEDDTELVATAKQLANGSVPKKTWRAPVWATAAVVLITLFTVINRNQESTPEPGLKIPAIPSTEDNGRQLRSVNRAANNLNVLYPEPGAGISPGSLVQWTDVQGNLHYDIYVLSMAGDVLWTERLADTKWVLDETLQLAAGSKYYFRVEAQFADGRSVSSKHVIFQVAQGQ